MNYLERQNNLHQDAEGIIQDINLVGLLSKYGELKIVGSYALELMAWEDIDVLVKGEPNYDKFLEVVNVLFKKENVYSLNIQDFRKSIYPDRPQGIYCGIKYLKSKDTFWKIDIWFLPESSAEDVVEEVKNKLTDETREIILTIKNEMREKTKHGKEVSGMDVYKAVLDNGVKNLEEFKGYLEKQDREL